MSALVNHGTIGIVFGYTSIFSTPFARFTAYLVIFAVGAALYETLRLLHLVSYGFVFPGLALIGSFMLIGFCTVHARNIMSRITSGSTLLALSVIAISFDSAIPSAYALVSVLVIAFIGALSCLHRPLRSRLKTIFYGALVFAAMLILGVIFLYVNTILLRVIAAQL